MGTSLQDLVKDFIGSLREVIGIPLEGFYHFLFGNWLPNTVGAEEKDITILQFQSSLLSHIGRKTFNEVIG
jgi:hypothetical protein